MSALAVLWFFLIFLLIAGYFVLDGFDLGVGILYPFLCKDERDQQICRRSIGPVWDGNEVWLLTAGGALFAAFPDAYATTFSGFYLAIMLVLFALIVRAVSFEFYEGDAKWRPVWNVTFFLGSLLPAILFGVAIGNVIAGIPMDADGNYSGIPLLGLITPFTLLTGLLGLVMIISAGACWLALKAPLGSDLQQKAAKLRLPSQLISFVLFAALTIILFATMGGTSEMVPELEIPRFLCALLFVVALAGAMILDYNGRKTGEGKSCLWVFLGQSVAAVALVFLLACSMFPVLVMASPDSVGLPLTLMNAGATDASLGYMTVILCIGLPFVLLYHVLIYRTFRGRVELPAE